MTELRVILTIASLSPQHGGPSRSTLALATALVHLGLRVELVACAESRVELAHLPPTALLTLHLLPPACRRTQWLASTNGFFRLIQTLARTPTPTILHDTGLWLPNNHACASAARRFGLPLVLSPRGMLSEWSLRFRGLKKRLAWSLYQRRALDTVALLHATSADEALEFRKLGLRQPIAIIPNGVDVPASPKTCSLRPLAPNQPLTPTRTALFLSRLHPKKGLLDLVEAWAALRPAGWRLRLVGGGEVNYLASVQSLVRERGLTGHFEFIGEVGDDEKWEFYRDADLFVLPSKSENFGLAIAEALACGVPVLTTRRTPWSDLVQHRCGWWVEDSPGPLAQALEEATSLTDQERHEMGARGATLIRSKYTWPRAAQQMKLAYECLLRRGSQPARSSPPLGTLCAEGSRIPLPKWL